MNKESVKSRLQSEDGISYTEFSYQLFQSFDFWHLFSNRNCTVQIGGSDQYGNITAGLDLIKRKSLNLEPDSCFGLTFPLLTTESGEKFGKSEGNAVFLDSSLLSIYDFYQFFRKVPDGQVCKLLKYLTLVPADHIDEIIKEHHITPKNQLAQRILAAEVTEMVHGLPDTQNAIAKARLLFDVDIHNVKASEIYTNFKNDSILLTVGQDEFHDLATIVVKSGALPSKCTFKLTKLHIERI